MPWGGVAGPEHLSYGAGKREQSRSPLVAGNKGKKTKDAGCVRLRCVGTGFCRGVVTVVTRGASDVLGGLLGVQFKI